MRMKRRLSLLMVLALLMSFTMATTLEVSAASKPDMQKANVKWDLKNNKVLKFKTKWSVLGVKQHNVKMTKFKVKDSKKKGYKECTFTLTFSRYINPTKAQVKQMAEIGEGYVGANGPFGGNYWYTIVDYKTGKSLEVKNDQKVTVTDSGWKYSNYVKKTSKEGWWIRYARKSTINVKIVYPKNYKNLAVGVGGFTVAPYWYTGSTGSGGVKVIGAVKLWKGKNIFSKETKLWSKKDKAFAHFMRVK